MRWIFCLSVTIIAAMLLASCGSTPAAPSQFEVLEAQVDQDLAIKPTLFVGKASDPNVYVAIVNRGSKVEAYICDGTTTKISLATWFEGTRTDGAFSAVADDGSSLVGTLVGEAISGTVTLPNQSKLTFTLGRSDQLPANLWQVFSGTRHPTFSGNGEPIGFRKGWIVLPDGTQRGGASKKPNPAITENINSTTGATNDGDISGNGTNPGPVTQGTMTLADCKGVKSLFDQIMAGMSTYDETSGKKKFMVKWAVDIMRGWRTGDCGANYGSLANPKFP
jgi:hypothetical protein